MYEVILDQIISLADVAKRWRMSDAELDAFIEEHQLQVFHAHKEPRVIFPRKDGIPIVDRSKHYAYRCTPYVGLRLVGSSFYQGGEKFLNAHIVARYEKEHGLTSDQEPLIVNEPQPQTVIPTSKTHKTANPSPAGQKFFVPRSLWFGKTPQSIRKAMRPREEDGYDGFPDYVIAHVLLNWHGLTNKTAIGRILGERDQNESTYLRLTKRLLEEAASYTITTDA